MVPPGARLFSPCQENRHAPLARAPFRRILAAPRRGVCRGPCSGDRDHRREAAADESTGCRTRVTNPVTPGDFTGYGFTSA